MPLSQNSRIRVSNFKLHLTPDDKAFILSKTEEVLDSHRWTVGPMGGAFEDAFKKFTHASHAVAVADGGAAIITVLQALKVPEGSIVVCPTLTAPPTPHAILAANMKVLFADSCEDDLGLDPEDIKQKLTQYKGKIGAVIAVHVGGWISPRLREIKKLCQGQGIPLIEDCAHAHGSWLEGEHAGSIAGVATFSFFMTKPLTSGEGGIVTSENRDLVEEIKIIRNYGKNEKGVHVIKGFNHKLSEFNAVVALWASLNAPRLIEERQRIAAYYNQELKNLEGIHIINVPECSASYYKYIVTVDSGLNRDTVKKRLLDEFGVEPAGGVYDTLCHEEPYFRTIPESVLNATHVFPQAERFARKQLCLPLYPGFTSEEQHFVIEGLRSAIVNGR